jgi:hypothetical protein
MKIKKFFNYFDKKPKSKFHDIDPFGEEIWEEETNIKKLYVKLYKIGKTIIENPNQTDLNDFNDLIRRYINGFNNYIGEFNKNFKVIKNGFFNYWIKKNDNVLEFTYVSKNNNFIISNNLKFYSGSVIIEYSTSKLGDYGSSYPDKEFILEFEDVQNAFNFLKNIGISTNKLEKIFKKHKD